MNHKLIAGRNINNPRYANNTTKINADGDCSYKIKRCLLLGKIAMTNLDSVLKSRDITLPTRVHIVKAMVFPVVMYRWTSPIAQLVKNPPAMQETPVRSLGQEDLLEKEITICSSILAWEIPWMEEPGRLHGVAKSGTGLSNFTFIFNNHT